MNGQSDSDLQRKAEDWLLHFPRLFDLYQHSDKSNPRNYFNVESPLPLSKDEERFARLDSESWTILRDKALPYVSLDDPLRHYQQLWSILDEARGYVLLADQSYERIEFIEPGKSKKAVNNRPTWSATKPAQQQSLKSKQ